MSFRIILSLVIVSFLTTMPALAKKRKKRKKKQKQEQVVELTLEPLAPLPKEPPQEDLTLEPLAPVPEEPPQEDLTLEPLAPVPEEPPQEDLTDIPLPELPLPTQPVLSLKAATPEHSHFLGYGGIVVGGIGVILTGVGIGFGVHSKSTYNSLQDDDTQLRAIEVDRDGKSAVKQANIFMGVGASLAVIGVGLAALDWVVLSSDAAEVSASPTGAKLTIRW